MNDTPEGLLKCTGMGTYTCQVPMPIGGRLVSVDACIADLVAALNAANIRTLASCGGHGNESVANIALEDGRMLHITGHASTCVRAGAQMVEGSGNWAADLITSLQAEVERLRVENDLLNEPCRRHPPCLECGAETSAEASVKCICAGDKDHCHGCEIWEDSEAEHLQERLEAAYREVESQTRARVAAESRLSGLVEALKTEPCYKRGGEAGFWINRERIMSAISRAKEAGLSDDDIKLLAGDPQ